MPFPTAHPAVVLPLRRYCPRWFNFPALIIGSLIPDAGYAFTHWQLSNLSHSFKGSFVLCLPAGLVAVAIFYALRRPLAGLLPRKHRELWLSACNQGPGSLGGIVLSLLVGTWGHVLIDSVTHGDGWLVQYLPWLRLELLEAGGRSLRVCHVLWFASTFAGTAWVAAVYLRWLGATTGSARLKKAESVLGYSLLLAALVFPCSLAHKLLSHFLGVFIAAGCALALVAAFALFVARRKSLETT